MIGIIVILVAILLPVIAEVKTQAYVASTQQVIGQIAGSIEAVPVDTGAFPGPDAQQRLCTVGPAGITTTENLTLGLCGGYESFGDTYVRRRSRSKAPRATSPTPPSATG